MTCHREFKISMALILVSLFCWAFWAQAAVPDKISYQGMLVDDDGMRLDGTYSMRFSLYDTLTSGNSLWEEEQSVLITDGIYNVQLGSANPIGSNLFSGAEIYLEVAIYNAGATSWETLSPRQQLTSAAYAFQAENAQFIEGHASEDFAPEVHQHSGADITTGMVDEKRIDLDMARDSEITWSNLSGIPADIADGDDTGISVETDPTVAASIKDGVAWDELSDIPSGFADGIDNNSGGDITGVGAGIGLSGGGSSGSVTLNIDVPLALSGNSFKNAIIRGTNSHATMPGVYGLNSSSGNFGSLGTGSYGVRGEHTSGNWGYLGSSSSGVYGYHSSSGNSGYLGTSSRGVYGYSADGTAGYFDSPSGNGLLVYRGNVGIRTTSPSAELEVKGEILISNDSSSKLRVGRYSAASPNAYIKAESSANQLHLQIGNVTKMVIDDSGNIGIGTSAPETGLEIRGNGTSWRRGFLCLKNLNEDAGIRIYDSYSDVKHHIFNVNDEGDILRLAPAGSYGSGGITISQTGNVGIGTVTPDNKLDVKGTIRSEELIVESGWADYVFNDDYVPMALDQVEKHIKLKGHLPGIPTEAEVKQNGIALGAFQAKLLEKIEELTLYLIEQDKKIQRQNSMISVQNQKLSTMKIELDKLRQKFSASADSML